MNGKCESPYFCDHVEKDLDHITSDISQFKEYEDNDPVDLGWYEWNTINSSTFRILLESDKSREMYGFKLEWEADTASGKCHNVCENKNCSTTKPNSVCNQFTGLCDCDTDYYLSGDNCVQVGWAEWGRWGECSTSSCGLGMGQKVGILSIVY